MIWDASLASSVAQRDVLGRHRVGVDSGGDAGNLVEWTGATADTRMTLVTDPTRSVPGAAARVVTVAGRPGVHSDASHWLRTSGTLESTFEGLVMLAFTVQTAFQDGTTLFTDGTGTMFWRPHELTLRNMPRPGFRQGQNFGGISLSGVWRRRRVPGS